jgi:uncharacterized RDD family membrane protein YckC
MTQYGDTAPAQPEQPDQAPQEPPAPSPYLQAGESVPQAYLAPPQPGMPSFGSARTPLRPGPRPFGPDQGSNGQQPYGQPRQPGTRPPYGRPRPAGRPGMRPGRDPALASGWERLLASAVDWLLIMIVSVLIFLSPLMRIWRQLKAIYPNLNSPGGQAALNTFQHQSGTVSTLLYFWLAVFGIALAYYWVMHAAWGATLGKRAVGVAVVTAADRKKVGVRAAGIRALAFLAGPAILLLVARIEYLGGIMWLFDNGLMLVDPRVQAGHDKLAGTVVIRQRRQSAVS